jgi:hypothetical protein
MKESDLPFQPIDDERRLFCKAAAAGALGIAALLAMPTALPAAELPALDESEPLAASMGYKKDTTKVDAKKYATHKADQACGSCQFFQGEAGSASGPCQIFPGKSVSSKGWCQVWAKKKAA